jgi:hypothetical protein
LPALQLLWALEARGFTLSMDVEGYLLVAPKSRLSDVDDRALREHRDEILALVQYCDRGVM